jgi:uncharacterized surface protein with fasciclin (FAS1) repeats
MDGTMKGTKTPFGFAAALVAVVVFAAACGDGEAGGGEPSAAQAPAAKPFGTACSDIPSSGEGSFEAMMTQPVVTAAAANPLLSMLVADLEEAQLTDTLNGAQDLTVFAPTDDAFEAAAAADPEGMQAMMADPTGAFAQLLTYHVVEGQLAPEALAGEHTTLQGQSLSVEGGGRAFTVNGTAMVVCGDIHTDNATVYVIDEVLHPPTT